MQKWEYITVKVEAHGFNKNSLSARYSNGRELQDWKRTPLESFIYELGERGWEMTGTWSTDTMSATNPLLYLFFKRSKP